MIICEIIVHLLGIVQNNKRCTVQVLKNLETPFYVNRVVCGNDLQGTDSTMTMRSSRQQEGAEHSLG